MRPSSLVLAAGVVVAALAGCSSDGGEQSGAAAERTSDPTNPADAGARVVPATSETVAAAPTIAVELPRTAGEDLIERLGLAKGATLTGDEAVEALVVLDAFRIELFRESTGFSGVFTFGETWEPADESNRVPDNPPTVADVTLLSSGDVWAEFDDGGWLHRDAAAGIVRRVVADALDGSPFPVEFASPLNLFEFDGVLWNGRPWQRLDGVPSTFRRWETPVLEVRSTVQEADPAIEVIAESETLGLQRWVVDLDTGLIVENESTQTGEKGTQVWYTFVTDLVRATVVPDAPPPPDGFEWEQLWSDATDQAPATVEEAREAFGSGLILPRSAIDEGLVALGQSGLTDDWRGVDADDPAAVVREVSVSHVEPDGLLRTVFSTSTNRPTTGAVPDGYEAIEDRLCHEGACTTDAGDMTPETGALAGVPLRGGGGSYSTHLNGVWIEILAPTEADALALVNSLVRIG